MELYNKKEQEKVAMILALSTDDTKWNKELISEFLSQYPMLQQTPMNITWKKKNANKGYGVGSIAILGGAVPVVVRNFQASPFDIIAFPGRVLPLDKYSIKEMMSSDNPFIGAADGKLKGSLSIFGDKELQQTPNDSVGTSGQGSYERPAVKVASFLDRINNFDFNDVRALAEGISEELGTDSLDNSAEITKIAGKATNYDKRWTDLLSSVSFDRQHIFEDREGNAYVKQAYSALDYSVVTPINDEERQNLTNLYAEQEKVAEKNDKIEYVAFDEIKMGQEGQFVDTHGNTTDKITIIGIEKIAELNDYVIIPVRGGQKSLVINESGSYIFVDKKVDRARNLDSLYKFVNTKPRVGSQGVWVVGGKTTEMFTIDKVIPDLSAPGNFEIIGMKGGFDVTYSLISTTLDGIPLKDGKLNEYWVPGNAYFVELKSKMYAPSDQIIKMVENQIDGQFKIAGLKNFESVEYIIKESEKIENNIIPNDAFFGIAKTGSQVIDDAPHIVYRDFGGFFHMFGPEFEKYASNDHETHNLNKQEIAWPLIHLGVSEDKVEEVLSMYPGDEIKIASHIKAPYTVQQFEDIAQRQYNDRVVEDHAIPKLAGAVKLASSYSDATTVDAVLSLGLVNKFNVVEYLDLIPDYERVLSELTRLLLYSRLTTLNFKSEVLEETVSSFNEVLNGLKGLREVLSYDKAALPSNI